MGDDGFGVEVVRAAGARALPRRRRVVDFGIRGMDLAYALAGYDVVVFVDAVAARRPPGTLYLIEPELDDRDAVPDAHGMDPVTVLALARELGDPLPRVLVVGCEPAAVLTREDDVVAELSEPVRAAVDDGGARWSSRCCDDLDMADPDGGSRHEEAAELLRAGRASARRRRAGVFVSLPEIQRYMKIRQM